jgi:anti-anti-sigma regulatory factor
MLKISGFSVAGQATLQLAGRLAGDWVGELKTACGLACAEHRHVILDFADVVFVDRTGAALVQSLLHQGMSLVNCSPFVTEQLKQVPPNKDVESGKS